MREFPVGSDSLGADRSSGPSAVVQSMLYGDQKITSRRPVSLPAGPSWDILSGDSKQMAEVGV